MSLQEKIAKLPVWVREHIADLERELVVKQRKIMALEHTVPEELGEPCIFAYPLGGGYGTDQQHVEIPMCKYACAKFVTNEGTFRVSLRQGLLEIIPDNTTGYDELCVIPGSTNVIRLAVRMSPRASQGRKDILAARAGA